MLIFLTSLLSRISKDETPDAYVLLLSSIAHAKLLFGDMEGTKTDIDESEKLIDRLDGIESSVHAAYYGVSADYYKVSPFFKALPGDGFYALRLPGQSGIRTLLQEFASVPRVCEP
jgi:hypothetical protein